MLKRPLFILVLEDESIFTGGSLQETKWMDIPKNKKIKRIFYSLPNKDYLVLENYNRYYHFIEATTDLSGQNAGKVRIEYAYIMGKKQERITCYKIALSYSGNHKAGDVQRLEYLESDNFIQKLNKDGWK